MTLAAQNPVASIAPRQTPPQRAAFRLPGRMALTHADLESRSRRAANWLRGLGLRPGDHLAWMLETREEVVVLAWAAQRAGLYYTPIPTHLLGDEAAYMAQDCQARCLVTSARFADLWADLRGRLPQVATWACVDPQIRGFTDFAESLAAEPEVPAGVEAEGFAMLYSSGTTGRPKGIKRPLSGQPFGAEAPAPIYTARHGMGPDTVYVSPAPLYHAAPLRAVMAVQRLGGQVVALERFTPEGVLAAIAEFRATHVQLVPTMMRRLLELPEAIRSGYDLSSLRRVIHAAAPCSIPLKRAFIDWVGPIVTEYYGGTEGIGLTYITSEEWLERPGSVGRAILGELHITGPAGEALGPGETGLVRFSGGPPFEYHNAPDKLAEARDAEGRTTLGDIGRVDEAGYLFLVDRRAFVINSGGVNIYPQEIEDLLRTHADVVDAAVFGTPDEDLGERVTAVVQPRASRAPDNAFAAELIAWCRTRLSHVKCPRRVDFIDELPRSDAGKLQKAELKARYWAGAGS